MVHFGKEVLSITEPFVCSTSEWLSTARLNTLAFNPKLKTILNPLVEKHLHAKTYGEIKSFFR